MVRSDHRLLRRAAPLSIMVALAALATGCDSPEHVLALGASRRDAPDRWSDVRNRLATIASGASSAPPLSVPASTSDRAETNAPDSAGHADGDVAISGSHAPVADRGIASHRSAAEAPTRRRARGAGPTRERDPNEAQDADASSTLRVTRLVVSRAVSGREPEGVATSFRTADVDRIYAFVELANDAREPGEIVVTFLSPTGAAVHRAALEVGSEAHWRTWAFTRRPKTPGTWTAVVTSTSGRVLARASFEITT